MPNTLFKGFDAFGTQEVGVYAGPAGEITKTALAALAITKTKWDDTLPEGWALIPSVKKVQRRNGRTGAVRKSRVQEVDLIFKAALPDTALDAIRRSLGLPVSAISGGLVGTTPTDEVLEGRVVDIGSAVYSIYASAPGPIGPRTLYLPQCSVSKLPELNQDRTKYQDNMIEFEVLEPSDYISFWFVDSGT